MKKLIGRIIFYSFAATLGIISLGWLWHLTNWKVAAAIFLFGWSNNMSKSSYE